MSINSNLNPTIEEFNKILEDNKPYNSSTYNTIIASSTIALNNTSLKYLIDLKILICSRYSIYLDPNITLLLRHFKVSKFYNLIGLY